MASIQLKGIYGATDDDVRQFVLSVTLLDCLSIEFQKDPFPPYPFMNSEADHRSRLALLKFKSVTEAIKAKKLIDSAIMEELLHGSQESFVGKLTTYFNSANPPNRGDHYSNTIILRCFDRIVERSTIRHFVSTISGCSVKNVNLSPNKATDRAAGLAFVDMHSTNDALRARMEIGTAILKDPAKCEELLPSSFSLQVRLKGSSASSRNDLNLVLSRLSNFVSDQDIVKLINDCRAEGLQRIKLISSNDMQFKLAFLFFHSSERTLSAKIKIESALSNGAVSFMSSQQAEVRLSIIRIEDALQQDPQELLNSFRATPHIERLFQNMGLIGSTGQSRKYGILEGGTGTGKTIGAAILSALIGQNVIIVVPKVVQVQMLVDFLKTVKFPRKTRSGVLKEVVIGYSAGRDTQYKIDEHTIIVVTYGHFLRCAVSKMTRSQDKTSSFSNYLVMLDEVHESLEHIQAVLCISDRILNQQIIISATMDESLMEKSIGGRIVSCSAREKIRQAMHEVEIVYEPTALIRCQRDLVEMVCKITKENLALCSENEKILIFVPGIKYIDSIRFALSNHMILDKSQSGAAHSELWDDEILDVVKCKRVIVATGILESSVTIEGLKVVIDTLLKNEMVNECDLEECRISKAEATQRAGRVGRLDRGQGRPDKVVRLIGREEYESLPSFPRPPFQLRSPCEVFLLLSSVFNFSMPAAAEEDSEGSDSEDEDLNPSSEIGKILHISDASCRKCKDELQNLMLLGENSVTDFGRLVLRVGMSLRFACTVVKVFQDRSPRCNDDIRLFVLLTAVAFENMGSFIFYLPLEKRLSTFREKLKYIKQDEYPGRHFLGACTIETVSNIIIEAIFEPGHIVSNNVVTTKVRDWCFNSCVNSKYVVNVLRQFVLLSVDLFRLFSLSRFTCITRLQSMKNLRKVFSTTIVNELSLIYVDEMIASGMRYFRQFFLRRCILEKIGQNERPIYSCTANATDDFSTTNTAEVVFLERIGFKPTFPEFAGCISMVRNKSIFDDRQGSPLRINGLFPIILDLDTISDAENLSQQQKSNTALMLGLMATQRRGAARSLRFQALTFLKEALLQLWDPTNAIYALMSFAQHDYDSREFIVESGAASALKEVIVLHQTKTRVAFAYAYAYQALRYLQDVDPSISTFLSSHLTADKIEAIERSLHRDEPVREADAMNEDYQQLENQGNFPIFSKDGLENSSPVNIPLNSEGCFDETVFAASGSTKVTTGGLCGVRTDSELIQVDVAKSAEQADVDQQLNSGPTTRFSIERLVERLHYGCEAEKEYAIEHLIPEAGNNDTRWRIVQLNAVPQLCKLSKSDDSVLVQMADELLEILCSGDRQTQIDLLESGIIKPFASWVHADFLVYCMQGSLTMIQNASKVLEILACLDIPASIKDSGVADLVYVLLRSLEYIKGCLREHQACSEEDLDRILLTLCRFCKEECFQKVLAESGNLRILTNVLISESETLLRKKHTLEIFQILAAGNEQVRQELTRQRVVHELVGIVRHDRVLYCPAIKCLYCLSLGNDNVKRTVVENGGGQAIGGIFSLKGASREIVDFAARTIQNLATGDDLTKKGLLCCSCIPPVLQMLGDPFESNCRRKHAIQFLVLICKNIEKRGFSKKTTQDIAEALAKVAQMGTQDLKSCALEGLWLLSTVRQTVEILVRAGSIEPATWFAIYGAEQEKEYAQSLLRALVEDKKTSLPDPGLRALSDSTADSTKRERTIAFLLSMMLIEGSSPASEFAVSVLELATLLDPYRECIAKNGGIQALVAKFNFEYGLNKRNTSCFRLVTKSLQNLVEGGDSVKLALIELNAFMPLKMLWDETKESNSVARLKTHVAHALNISCQNLSNRPKILNGSIKSKLFERVLRMAKTGTACQKNAAQEAVLRLSLGHEEGLRKQIVKAGALPVLVDIWRKDNDLASSELAAGAVLELFALNDMEDEMIKAGVFDAVHETIKHKISSSTLVDLSTGIFVPLCCCHQTAQLIKAQPNIVSILVNVALESTSDSRYHAVRALGHLADSTREIDRVLLRAGAVKPFINILKDSKMGSGRAVELQPLLLNALKKYASYDADTRKALLEASIFEPFVLFLRERPVRLENEGYIDFWNALEAASRNGSNHVLICQVLQSIVPASLNYAPAFRILQNLACGSEDIKRLLIASAVFEPFVKMIVAKADKDKVTEHALILLKLASEDRDCCLKLIQVGALQPILKILADAPTVDFADPSVSREALLTLKNLAAGCVGSKKALAEAGAVNTFMRLALNSTHEVEMLATSALISLTQGDESTKDLLLLAGAAGLIAAKSDQLGSDQKGHSLCSLLHLSSCRDKSKLMESVIFKLLVETVQSSSVTNRQKSDAVLALKNLSEGDYAIKCWLLHMGVLNTLIWLDAHGGSGTRQGAAEILNNLSVILQIPGDLPFKEMAVKTVVSMAQDTWNMAVQSNGLSALETILQGDEEAKRLILKHCPARVIVYMGRTCKGPLLVHVVKSMEMIALSEGSLCSLDAPGGIDLLIGLLSGDQHELWRFAGKALRSLCGLGSSARAALVQRGAVPALMLHAESHTSCSDMKSLAIDALQALAAGGEEEEEVCKALTCQGAMEVLLSNSSFALDTGSVRALVRECSRSVGTAGNKAAAAIAAAMIASFEANRLGGGEAATATTASATKELLSAGAVEALVEHCRQRPAQTGGGGDGGGDASHALAAMLADPAHGREAADRALAAGVAGALGPLVAEASACSDNDRRMLAQGALEALLAARAAGQGLGPPLPGAEAVVHSVTNGTQPMVRHAAQALGEMLGLGPGAGAEDWQRIADGHASFLRSMAKGGKSGKGRSKR